MMTTVLTWNVADGDSPDAEPRGCNCRRPPLRPLASLEKLHQSLAIRAAQIQLAGPRNHNFAVVPGHGQISHDGVLRFGDVAQGRHIAPAERIEHAKPHFVVLARMSFLA